MRPPKKDQKLISAECLEATGRLASEMAHELNTPLGGILMYSHLLLEAFPEDDARRENAVKITKLAHRCRIIVESLREFARQQPLQLKQVQVNRILQNVIGFLEDHVLFRNISIETCLDSDLPIVPGDENKLEQVFINLFINAAQSMNSGGTLTLYTEFAHDTKHVGIKCSDTGCGIDEEQLDKIFEPFFTTREEGDGTGLGLSICHGIVQQHGGTITVESSKGHGSTFTILLPADWKNVDSTSGVGCARSKTANRKS